MEEETSNGTNREAMIVRHSTVGVVENTMAGRGSVKERKGKRKTSGKWRISKTLFIMPSLGEERQ